MTENEAIDKLNNLHYKIVHTSFRSMVYESEIEALCMAKDCLKEIQQYREIGTVEEFKALKEKIEPKKPIRRQADERIDILDFCTQKGDVYLCPSCNDYIICADIKHCWNCGQKLDLE